MQKGSEKENLTSTDMEKSECTDNKINVHVSSWGSRFTKSKVLPDVPPHEVPRFINTGRSPEIQSSNEYTCMHGSIPSIETIHESSKNDQNPNFNQERGSFHYSMSSEESWNGSQANTWYQGITNKLNRIATYLKDQNDNLKESSIENEVEMEWKAMARKIDDLCMKFYLIALALGHIIVLGAALVQSGGHEDDLELREELNQI